MKQTRGQSNGLLTLLNPLAFLLYKLEYFTGNAKYFSAFNSEINFFHWFLWHFPFWNRYDILGAQSHQSFDTSRTFAMMFDKFLLEMNSQIRSQLNLSISQHIGRPTKTKVMMDRSRNMYFCMFDICLVNKVIYFKFFKRSIFILRPY